MTDPTAPNPFWDSLLDYVRGECEPAEAARIEARLAVDPALAKEKDRLTTLLVAAKGAHEVRLDAGAVGRVVARVRDQVRREEEQRERVARVPRRVLWARLLAISVGAHVLALGVLSLKMHQEAPRPGALEPFKTTASEGRFDGGLPEDAEPPTVADMGTIKYDGRLRAEAFVPPEDLAPFRLPSPDLDEPLAMRDPRLDPFLPSVRRQMLFRSLDDLKRVMLSSTGSRDAGVTLARVKGSLRFLSGAQRADGSFAGPDGEPSVRATALALLTFLGDGHSARGEEYASVVDRGMDWLKTRAASAPFSSARALALYAMVEDFMLSNGVMTPAESAERGREIGDLALTLGKAPTKGEDAVWTPLALAAATRAGLLPATGSVDRASRWAGAFLDAASFVDFQVTPTDPKDALRNGLALLLAPRVKSAKFPAFPSWNADTLSAVSAMLGPDGAVLRKHAAGDPTRVESTALVALTLELAFRTF